MQVMATQTCEASSSEDEWSTRRKESFVASSSEQTSDSDGCREDGLLELHDSSDDDTHSSPLEKASEEPAQRVNEPRPSLPPRRKLLRNVDLLSLPARNQLPVWLTHTTYYLSARGNKSEGNWFPPVGPRGIGVRLSRPAPSRKQVIDWQRNGKRKCPDFKSDDAHPTKHRKLKGSAKTKLTGLGSNLAIDSNSRQLELTTLEGGGIEEVEWELTQVGTQEACESQQSPNAQTDRKGTAQTENERRQKAGQLSSPSPEMPGSTQQHETPNSHGGSPEALQGIGNQGGRLWIEGGGTLKSKTRHSQAHVVFEKQHGSSSQSRRQKNLATPVTIMSVEIHVQCRTGRAGHSDTKQMAMVPNSDRDKISAVVYVFAKDPGGGDQLQILERGCIFVPVEREMCEIAGDERGCYLKRLAGAVHAAIPKSTLGSSSPISVECVEDERKLLLRFSAKVLAKDPDMILSWDPQGSGLGFIVERGFLAHKEENENQETRKTATDIDMACLLGRLKRSEVLPKVSKNETTKQDKRERWKGSGLGKDWDERVGPGVAAASIEGRLVFATWKLVAEEVKHPNASYLQAIVSSVLNQRIPFHDNLRLTQWYAQDRGRERYRVLHHKLTEATAGLLLLDALDIVGRAGEAARLSGVEFSQSFPGIRGSQYKVEGVLLRSLKSLNSFERGSKKGVPLQSTAASVESPLVADPNSQSQVRMVFRFGSQFFTAHLNNHYSIF